MRSLAKVDPALTGGFVNPFCQIAHQDIKVLLLTGSNQLTFTLAKVDYFSNRALDFPQFVKGKLTPGLARKGVDPVGIVNRQLPGIIHVLKKLRVRHTARVARVEFQFPVVRGQDGMNNVAVFGFDTSGLKFVRRDLNRLPESLGEPVHHPLGFQLGLVDLEDVALFKLRRQGSAALPGSVGLARRC